MAEALGVAGSVVSFVGLAGQVAQGINYLYNFFNTMKDAPSDVKSLAEELKVLGTILDEVDRDRLDSAPVGAALQRCKDVIEELEDLIRKSNLTTEQSRTRKIWSQMSAAFRNEKFRKYTEQLERAKSMLLHAKLEAHGSMHQQQLNGIKGIQDSLLKMSVQHSEIITRTTETGRLSRTDLEALPSRVSGLVMGEVSTAISRNHATCSTILTEVRASSIKADQSSEEIKLAIQSLLSDLNTSRIAALLQPALEKAISDQIVSSIESLTAHLANPQAKTTRKSNKRLDPEDDSSPNKTPQYAENQFGVQSLNSLSSTTTCIRWAGESKVFDFWFGRLIFSTSALDSWQGHGNGVTIQKAEFLETQATLIPSKWLLRKGAVLKITRLVSAIVAPSIQFSLTPIMVISEDNEIVAAMNCGDLAKVKRLIIAGEVHPSSIFPDGSNLVHKCIQQLERRIIPDKTFRYKRGRYASFEADDLSPVNSRIALKMIDIAGWLMSNGSATDALNIYGKCPLSALNDIIYTKEIDTPSTVKEELEQLGILILRTSNILPFFIRQSENGQMEATEMFMLRWWHFLNIIAKGSRSDISTSICLSTLHLLWDFPPYSQSPRMNQSDDPENWTSELSSSAFTGKLWLAGDPEESARCSHLLFRSIRGALVRASPYKQFHKYDVWHRRSDVEKIFYQENVINAIAEMLRIEKEISTYSEGNESLTEVAIRWRSLDIWKLALERAGCQPISTVVWNANAHFYDPSGFVSHESGTSVRVTGDADSGKVMLVVDERQYGWDGEWEPQERRYPRDLELKNLTKNWPCIIKFPRVHCEVYPSPPVGEDLAAGKATNSARDGNDSMSKYTLQPTDDGGMELFIDCCEIGEPWERICTEVEREQCQRDGLSSQDSDSKTSEDEHSDSKTYKDGDNGGASKGIFSKIAEVGVDILSAIV